MFYIIKYICYIICYIVCFAAPPPAPPSSILKVTKCFCRTTDGQNHRSIEWGGDWNGVGEGRRGGRIGESLRPGQCLRKYMLCECLRFLFHFLIPRTHEFSFFLYFFWGEGVYLVVRVLQHCAASVGYFNHFKSILNLSFSDPACVHTYFGAFRTSSFWIHLVSRVFEANPVRGHVGSILYIVTLGLSCIY